MIRPIYISCQYVGGTTQTVSQPPYLPYFQEVGLPNNNNCYHSLPVWTRFIEDANIIISQGALDLVNKMTYKLPSLHHHFVNKDVVLWHMSCLPTQYIMSSSGLTNIEVKMANGQLQVRSPACSMPG